MSETKNDELTDSLFNEIVYKNNKYKRHNRRRLVFWILVLIIFGYLLYYYFLNTSDPLDLEEMLHLGTVIDRQGVAMLF